jgi:lipid A ethanolaminephosphotransferase
MSLKLFRSTGYSSLLSPGHSRDTMHPAWVVLASSLWVGFACNVPLWRALIDAKAGTDMTHALLQGVMVSAGCGLALSFLAWRVMLKPVASVILLVAALMAIARWDQAAPRGAGLVDVHLADKLLPSWASLLHWHVPALLAVLAIVPMVWVWNAPVKRLPGPQQLRSNIRGMAAAAILFGITAVLLFGGWA